MDYPKSVPGVGLVDGQFVDEDQVAGTPGSLIPAGWGNAVTREILNLMAAGGQVPAEGDHGQMAKAVAKMIENSRPAGVVKNYSVNASLTAADMGLLLLDATGGARIFTLPAANEALGVADLIVRRTDNSGNRLTVRAVGDDRIKFHTDKRADGYPFFYLLGAGDYWHLRSDGAGSWWLIGRLDGTALGRPVFETTTMVSPGGWGVFAGSIFDRAEWPWLWDHAQQSGMLTTEAARVGMEGGWTSGDGIATFRGPEGRGEFLRILDDGRGVDAGRVVGSWQSFALQAHDHVQQGANTVPNSTGNGALNVAAINGIDGGRTRETGGTETRPRNIAYPGRIKLI